MAEPSYLACDNGKESPYVNQFFVEGKGKVTKDAMERAIQVAHEKNPGISLKLKGRWAWRYWALNPEHPIVIEYQGPWQGNDSSNKEMIDEPFNTRRDVLCTVILFNNIQNNGEINFKILFRIHHAICDGVGTLHWIKEVFRALREETLLGSRSDKNELDIIQQENYPPAETLLTESLPVFPISTRPEARGCHWIQVRWPGKDTKILAKLIFILKNIAEEQHGKGKTTFRIPADLRRYLSKEDKATAQLVNMSGLFDLRFDSDVSVNDIQNTIIKTMRNKQDLSVYPKKLSKLTPFLPTSVFLPKAEFLKDIHTKGICHITGTISYVGKANLTEYSCPGFQALGMYAIPMPLEDKSIYIGLFTDDAGIQAVLSAPNALSNIENTKALADRIARELESLN